MASNPGNMLKRANPSTIQDKFLVGYQGWFTCAGDGEPVDPGHHGWLHWFNYPIPDGGRPNTDFWPDVSSCSPSELFPAPGLKSKFGEQTFLFSSRNPKTVQRHFHWMAQHGVDGAFLQRFAGQCDLELGRKGIRRMRDEVGQRVREAAEQEGRVFAIMYDVSGVLSDRIQGVLQRDWTHLVHDLGVLDSPSYLREKGKPVIALWGFGFDNAGHTPALVSAITRFFRNATPGGVYIMGGAPTQWRTADGDADPNPGFLDVWLNEFDAISPWAVGRYRTDQDADNFAEKKMKGDLAIIKKRNEEDAMRKVDYIPVVFPGFSGYNLSEGKWGFNMIKREGGKFLWRQIYNARRLGVRTMYGAMWDEYDEGTAFMPIVEHKRDLPESDKYPFLALDADGHDIPSDWYMRICGFAAEGLRNERLILDTFPVKELQDYWSSRPRYEDVNINSKDFMSGSSSLYSADVGGDGVDLRDSRVGQTYQEWLALQKEEKEDAPPPPYTLEVNESADSIPSQHTVTNAATRDATITTTPEVPSVAVQNAPAVVANVEPVASSTHAVASPPAVNKSSYPTSAGSASQEHIQTQVGAQSTPPRGGHSPHPYAPPGGVHHPPSSHGYLPPSGLQRPVPLHPLTQAHSSQVHLRQTTQSYLPPVGPPHQQSYPPAVGKVTQSYPPAHMQVPQSHPPAGGQPAQSYHPQYGTPQGQLHPIISQGDQSYLPPAGAPPSHVCSPLPQRQSPHAHSPVWGQHHPPSGGSSCQGYPTSTGQSHAHSPSLSPNAQSYSTSGGPVRQGHTPADGSTLQSYHNTINMTHNQSPDPAANDFRRQSILGLSEGAHDERLSPLAPAHSTTYTSRPPRPSTAQSRPTSQSPNRPSSQSGRHSAAVSPSSSLSPSVQETAVSTQNRPRWPPAEWDADMPPVQKFSSHRPSLSASKVGHGANLPQFQTHSASSYNSGAAAAALKPTVSMSNKPPPSRPNTNTTPGHYVVESTYSNNVVNTHDYYAVLSPGHPAHGQSMGFSTGPQYRTTSTYSGQQSASMYDSAVQGSSYATWAVPGHVSPSPSPPIGFPGSRIAHGGPEPSHGSSGMGGSQYHSGPTGNVQFPQALGGDACYFGSNMPSPPFPNQGGGSPSGFRPTSPYPQSAWMSAGPPPMHPQYSGPSFGGSNTSLEFALNAVDKVAGRRARDQVESQVESLVQSSSKLLSKFTK